jgi:hypothetical protein
MSSRKKSPRFVEQDFRLAKDTRQPLRPRDLTGLVSQQILADFDLNVRNRAPLAVYRNRVV